MNDSQLQLSNDFRAAMAALSAPVTIITSVDEDGPHGTTVTAFTSLSMTPPMAMVSLDLSSNLLAVIKRTGRFGVNILGSAQSAHASGFARKGIDKFAGVDWRLDAETPRIDGSLGWLSCRVSAILPGGDHEIILGDVVRADSGEGEPLLYFQRDYGTHLPLSKSDALRDFSLLAGVTVDA